MLVAKEFTVEQVRVELVRRLRREVLRPGLPLEASVYPSDYSPDAQHFAAWSEKKIVGVASIFPEKLEGFENAWRLRGMAVDEKFRGSGVGTEILRECVDFIKQFGAEALWCNGRTSALPFYRAFGFETRGAEFNVPESGAHFVTILRIKN